MAKIRKIDKKRVEKMREERVRGRWVVLSVFGVMMVMSLGFWIKGQWKGKLLENPFKSEPVVWQKEGSQLSVVSSQNQRNIDTSELREQIKGMVEDLRGTYVIYGKSLGPVNSWELKVGPEGEEFMSQPMRAASLIKVPVMVATYRLADEGVINLNDKYVLREEDRVGGSGSLVGKPAGYEISWRKLIWHMGNESDNTAFQAVVNKLGEGRLEEEFKRMGLLSVSIRENQITVGEIVKLFEGLYTYKWLDKSDSEEILNSMVKTWYEDRIPAFAKATAGKPKVRIAHKVGTEVGVISDVGIVYTDEPYLLVIMTEEVNEVEARGVLPEISRIVWEWVEQL